MNQQRIPGWNVENGSEPNLSRRLVERLAWTQPWPGGESPEQFYQRIKCAWRAFQDDVQNRTVLLVTHGGVMNVILCLENGVAYTNKETRYRIADAEIIAVER